jgi:DNA-binding NarL/FixJ family response regulator
MTDDHSGIKKTKIAEIDDLLEYLAAQDEQRDALAAERESIQGTRRGSATAAQAVGAPNLSAYEEFIKNIDTLSTAEKAVFDLYMQGYTAREISELLYLSINTIKTHNKRIYTKLNVTSRKELMVYVQMMATEQDKEETCL